MTREKTNRLVIYQAKPQIPFEAFDVTDAGYTLDFEDANRKLFVERNKFSTPSWATYISPLLPPEAARIANYNCSLIFVIRHNASIYILAGGSGYSDIQDYIVEDFGLNMALRMIDGEISAMTQTSMKGTTRQIIRAVMGYEPSFDRDNYTRILNAIHGKAFFEGKKLRIEGKSSLALRTVRDIGSLGQVLDQIEQILAREERVHFPKSYKEVKDQGTITQLEAQMFETFQRFWRGEIGRENLYLEFKDPFVQFRCETFHVTFKHHRVDLTEFDLEVIRDELKAKGFGQIEEPHDLQKMTVTGVNESGYAEIKKEPVYNLLVFEATLAGIHYIKLGKKWFQILEEIQDFINKELSTLPIWYDKLPGWDKAQHLKEEDYNRYVAAQKNWACLDQDFVHLNRSKIELCDLYDHTEKAFYHIKETWGCKSAYLFTQGITAAESYRQLATFRAKCVEKWPHLFAEEVTKGNIVYGIAADQAFAADFPRNMTYFAKLNLYNAVSSLKAHNFDVALAPIRLT